MDGTDFALLAGNFGRSAGALDVGAGGLLSGAAAAVPEPSALCTFGLAVVLLGRARARRRSKG